MKTANIYDSVLDHDPVLGRNVVQIDSPIATIVRCDSHLFLCIGEVNDITIDSRHTDLVGVEYLTEPLVYISYQMLILVPATIEDDPDLKNDWCWTGIRGKPFRVSGCLVQPINPSLSTKEPGNPYYLFESDTLMATGSSILEQVTEHAVSVPSIKKSETFP
jgi:hypothetical protein